MAQNESNPSRNTAPFSADPLHLALLGVFALGLAAGAQAAVPAVPATNDRLVLWSRPIAFEANRGQLSSEHRFFSRGDGFALLFGERDVTLGLSNDGQSIKQVRFVFPGASNNVRPEGIEPLPGYTNYLTGTDAKDWVVNVPSYAKVRYPQLYQGVDLVFYGAKQRFEFDFVLAPNANPNQIRMKVEGASKLALSPQGDLLITTTAGEVQSTRPQVYQIADDGSTVPVAGRYKLLADNTIAFQVGGKRNLKTVIDPVINYTANVGGAGTEAASTVLVDKDGNPVVVGTTTSNAFWGNTGSDRTRDRQAFVTKLDRQTGKALFTTYIGGSGDDWGNAGAIDAAGNIYVAGKTCSADFPQTAQLTSTSRRQRCDAFVTKLWPKGDAVSYSTRFGGTGETGPETQANGIAVDKSGRAWVVGGTRAFDFRQVSPLPQEQPLIGSFVSRLSSAGDALELASVLGGSGSGREWGRAAAVALDAAENAVVVGLTSDINFRPTNNASQRIYGGYNDAYAALISPNNQLIAATYLGGSDTDAATTVAVAPDGQIYVGGYTDSPNFPQRNSTSSRTYKFLTSLSSDLSKVNFSTFIGGSGDFGTSPSMRVDKAGNVWIADTTAQQSYPTVGEQLPRRLSNHRLATISQYDPTGKVLYASLFGGSGDTYGTAVNLTASGEVLLAGTTNASDLPGFSNVRPQNGDVFVSKIAMQAQSGWWWVKDQPGRGFFIEIDASGHVFMATFLYELDGRATWVTSRGAMSGSRFSAPLTPYANGQSLTGSYRLPVETPSPGNVDIQFTGTDKATLTWPGGSFEISRFEFATNGLAANPIAGSPESGWWWNGDEAGRGFAIEIQDNKLFMTGFLYDESGRPTWYLTTATLSSPNTYTGTWVEYAGGQALNGPYRAPSVVNGSVGSISLQFSSATAGTLTLPNGRQVPLSRFRF